MQKTGFKALSFLFAVMLVSLTCMPMACASPNEAQGVATTYEEAARQASLNSADGKSVAAVPILIGIYYVGGYELGLYVGGVISLYGLYYYSGSVYDWLMSLIQGSYEDAREQGTPAGHHETVYNSADFGTTSAPDSSKDYVPAGVVKQRRYYGHNGQAQMDIDYYDNASDPLKVYPHRHDWVNGVRGLPYLP